MTNKKLLDKIVDSTLVTVEDSREQIFEIGEQSRTEYEKLKQELADVRAKVAGIIDESDHAEFNARLARNHLAEVSKIFRPGLETEMKDAYEVANKHQVQLALLKNEEAQLRDRRDTLERRLIGLNDTMERAEQLAGQLSIVYNFLAKDLKEVSEAIEDAQEKHEFGLKIIEAQEEERKRVSRDIHDGPAQMMANVLLRSELIERVCDEQGIEKAKEEIRELRKAVRTSLKEVRRIIYDLRPMVLDDLGIIPTLAKYIETFQEGNDVQVTFKLLGKERRFSHQFEISIFRLVQEAMTNAYKHANPKEILVRIEIRMTDVIIVIKNDGKGFTPDIKKDGSFGLIGMKERVNMLKGKMDIMSKIETGTIVHISLPIQTSQ